MVLERKHLLESINATGYRDLYYSSVPRRYSVLNWLLLASTMEPPDPGTKLPEGTHGKSRDTNGRKERGPPASAGPSGSNPNSGDVIHREPSGKGGKGKSSTPKKK